MQQQGWPCGAFQRPLLGKIAYFTEDHFQGADHETKAIQRLKSGASAVSEVRSPPLNPLEIKRNLDAKIGK